MLRLCRSNVQNMQQTMPNWLQNRAYLTPNRVAIEWSKQEITFATLHKQVEKTVRQLTTYRIYKGDTVAVHMTNSIEMILVIHALQYMGVVAVLLNTRLTIEEIKWQVEDANAKQLICDTYIEGISIPQITTAQWSMGKEASIELQTHYHLDDVTTILYTSGTTGNPKGVMLTYGNHYHSAIGSALNLGLHQDDSWLACLPMFHVGGFSLLMKSIIYGMKIVMHESFDVRAVYNDMMKGKVTLISVVTKTLQEIITLADQPFPKTFRCALLGGGPAPISLIEECLEKGVNVYQTYGMTETASQIATLAPEYVLAKIGSAGKPLFPCELQIRKDGTNVSAYEEGEIVVKGPNVTQGYYNREEATKETIQDGWLYTGDIGYLDDEGFLYVLDRRKDLIISGGENIYPAQIEAALMSHPQIMDAGVIGMEDDQWGQVPVAFVIASGLSAEEIFDYCYTKLARYKVPKHIYFTDSLPRNASNKLVRRNLYEWLGE
ncbi:O-succinylbenzoic acid--CoA ligase [Priestia taiwanensis]|uniref:2-succinylbenzoate--CoA ligase n=2 Tax=Priestia taiwanensis TaxID=1347902 RepID=A0A917AWT0_9BACI|nr:O-succinylbenzoic acid--CoA ligase [Priestia taiwanensis]GGE78078.1 2-succinylbenzoate--CoA ligase [Priestia taiwanensis]